MDLVADHHLVAEAEQAVAVRAVAEDQQMDIVADDLQQVGRPDGVLHPLLRPQSPDQADQPALLGQAQLGEELSAGGVGRAGRGHAVGDDANPLRRQSAGDVEIAHAGAVGHDARRNAGRRSGRRPIRPSPSRDRRSVGRRSCAGRRTRGPRRSRRHWPRRATYGPDRAALRRRDAPSARRPEDRPAIACRSR